MSTESSLITPSAKLNDFIRLWMIAALLVLAGCQPSPTGNVIGYLAAQRMGRLTPAPPDAPRGSLAGLVMGENGPLSGASIVVAERTGQAYSAVTDADGRFQIDEIPAGQYTPAAVAPGYAELIQTNLFGTPKLVTVRPAVVSEVPIFQLRRLRPDPFPQPWPDAAHLTLTATDTLTASFPAGSMAEEHAYTFVREGLTINTLRLYLPVKCTPEDCLPLLFMVYPTQVDLWRSVSTAYAAQGYALVAISPMAERGTEIAAHAEDARWALYLARNGDLNPQISSAKAVALGGSFSSAILHQLTRRSGDSLAGWVTVGGISDAFAGAAAFYKGALEIPPQYQYLIPALGMPNLYPLLFLRYSPVYTAAELPPTLIIHTAADRVIPIEQAYELEAALRQADVPVEAFYYEDVSHYLQIDEHITEAGKEMFLRTLRFAEPLLHNECAS